LDASLVSVLANHADAALDWKRATWAIDRPLQAAAAAPTSSGSTSDPAWRADVGELQACFVRWRFFGSAEAAAQLENILAAHLDRARLDIMNFTVFRELLRSLTGMFRVAPALVRHEAIPANAILALIEHARLLADKHSGALEVVHEAE